MSCYLLTRFHVLSLRNHSPTTITLLSIGIGTTHHVFINMI